MLPFILTAVCALIIYLILTAGSGIEVLGLWSFFELYAGFIVALVVGAISEKFFIKEGSLRMLNPFRWLLLVFYCIFPFFIEMTKANLDVAYRVITGKIRPGIIRISPDLKTDLGILLMANSITLTPGTLTVDVDEKSGDLFIHVLNLRTGVEEKDIADEKDIFSLFNLKKWIRRIAE
ncbi:cation:proton antiporter [Methanoplanus sp. FWC-SCC4]|uniref:Cation:proton antiporter n=1 Tax=Methanochimaera problematica TaxID=2609417 RepID=A0AA97FC70_9EURY|nr:Na+/H+ antiporter subunit E [Methanoplanus sp. FWC-SCC4]WOF16372.1 cation:proton antiporter [Methanoplanus sp. FWC-SCC4]